MVNEWIPIELYGYDGAGEKRRYTIADGVSVSVGAALQLLDPNTVSYGHLANVAMAGVAAEEHVANKGVVDISVWTKGDFDVLASGAIGIGDWIQLDLSNAVKSWNLNPASSAISPAASFASVIGRTKETASDNEVIRVALRL